MRKREKNGDYFTYQMSLTEEIGIELLVVGLMFVGGLFIGGAIQAAEGRVEVVSVECDGNCNDSTLGQLCTTLLGQPPRNLRNFRPVAVDCQNVQEHQDEACPGSGNNRCFVREVSPNNTLGDYCDDINGWDAQVYCEEFTSQEGTLTLNPPRGFTGGVVYQIPFTAAFTSIPTTVLATVRGGNFPDVFALTVRNVTTTSFQAVLFRIDSFGTDWGQALQLDWRASE